MIRLMGVRVTGEMTANMPGRKRWSVLPPRQPDRLLRAN